MMTHSILKTFRIVLALVFFTLVTYFFLDLYELIPVSWINAVLIFQFGPSLVKFIKVTGATAVGLLGVSILTLLFGRIYCSTLCPLGTLQDIISRGVRKIRHKPRYRYRNPLNWLRYTILVVTVGSLLAGGAIVFTWLGPFSNFGKIVQNIFRPLFIGGNNAVVHLLEIFDNYQLMLGQVSGVSWGALLFSCVFLGLLIWLAGYHGRLFCNSLCPVGAILGVISRFSVFKIGINKEKCTTCGKCALNCKAGCIDLKQHTVDNSRCISCFNCLSACPEKAIGYQSPARLRKHDVDRGKRSFLSAAVMSAAGISGLARVARAQTAREKPSPTAFRQPASPPGSGSHAHFLSTCTACHLCVSQCPGHVLRPALFEYGLSGFMKPVLDYQQGFCSFDCTRCSDICPAGALQSLSLEAKHTTQIGRVVFKKQNCIVYQQNTDCGACAEHCPTKAVFMVPYGAVYIPNTNPELCVGCGACEYVCPAVPYKAIYVEGLPKHGIASKPQTRKQVLDDAEDFPF
ncbi:4Fe-4S binding protein [bacterium]|nr:4Fe-4S binding protein [bacterium]